MLSLAILSFLLLSVQIWVRTFEQSDQRHAQRFRGEAVRSLMAIMSNDSLSRFANASAYYATYKLVNYTAYVAPLVQVPDPEGHDARNEKTAMVNYTIADLMANGTCKRYEPNIIYTDDEKAKYTFESWQNRAKQAAGLMGFAVEFSNMSNFTFVQQDEWTVNISFAVRMNLTDKQKTMSHSTWIYAKTNFSIEGFLDPSITRNDYKQRLGSGLITGTSTCPGDVISDIPTQKQIFRAPSDLKNISYYAPTELPIGGGNQIEGQGWFYGPVTEEYPKIEVAGKMEDNPGAVPPENRSRYILVHEYNESLLFYAEQFGAVVVTSVPDDQNFNDFDSGGCEYREQYQTGCLNCLHKVELRNGTDCPPNIEHPWELIEGAGANKFTKPFIAVSGIDYIGVNDQPPRPDAPADYYILIDNEFDSSATSRNAYHRVWDIGLIRNAAFCGLYINGTGPSFFQRMLDSSALNLKNDKGLGIESFVVGKWAGGAQDPLHYGNSRLDWEFYSSTAQNVKIKGMPGCKNKEMCEGGSSNDATKCGVGVFRLTEDAIRRYGLEKIACRDSQGASCG